MYRARRQAHGHPHPAGFAPDLEHFASLAGTGKVVGSFDDHSWSRPGTSMRLRFHHGNLITTTSFAKKTDRELGFN
jgi:hypothetical protein